MNSVVNLQGLDVKSLLGPSPKTWNIEPGEKKWLAVSENSTRRTDLRISVPLCGNFQPQKRRVLQSLMKNQNEPYVKHTRRVMQEQNSQMRKIYTRQKEKEMKLQEERQRVHRQKLLVRSRNQISQKGNKVTHEKELSLKKILSRKAAPNAPTNPTILSTAAQSSSVTYPLTSTASTSFDKFNRRHKTKNIYKNHSRQGGGFTNRPASAKARQRLVHQIDLFQKQQRYELFETNQEIHTQNDFYSEKVRLQFNDQEKSMNNEQERLEEEKVYHDFSVIQVSTPHQPFQQQGVFKERNSCNDPAAWSPQNIPTISPNSGIQRRLLITRKILPVNLQEQKQSRKPVGAVPYDPVKEKVNNNSDERNENQPFPIRPPKRYQSRETRPQRNNFFVVSQPKKQNTILKSNAPFKVHVTDNAEMQAREELSDRMQKVFPQDNSLTNDSTPAVSRSKQMKIRFQQPDKQTCQQEKVLTQKSSKCNRTNQNTSDFSQQKQQEYHNFMNDDRKSSRDTTATKQHNNLPNENSYSSLGNNHRKIELYHLQTQQGIEDELKYYNSSGQHGLSQQGLHNHTLNARQVLLLAKHKSVERTGMPFSRLSEMQQVKLFDDITSGHRKQFSRHNKQEKCNHCEVRKKNMWYLKHEGYFIKK